MKTGSIDKAAHKHFPWRTSSRNPILSFPLFSEFCFPFSHWENKDNDCLSRFKGWSSLKERVIALSAKYPTFLILPGSIKSGGKNKNKPFWMVYPLIRLQILLPQGGKCTKLGSHFLALWRLASPPGQEDTSLFRVCLLPSPGLYEQECSQNMYYCSSHTWGKHMRMCENMFKICRKSHQKFILAAYLRL